MNLHANAALSLNRRRQLCRRVVDERWTLTKAAEAAEVSVRCARKWVGRYRAEGELGPLDRSSAPSSIPHRTSEERVQAIAALRRLRFTGPEIAETLGMALSTVSGVLTRIGMGKLGRLGLEPAQRYERERPGELIHIDVKKLGRILRPGHRITGRRNSTKNTYTADGRRIGDAGWEYVHIAIDDCTRLAYAEVLDNEKATTVVAFLRRAVTFFERHGMDVQQPPHRQRPWLSLRGARARVPRPGDPPPKNPRLQAPDKRQGRAIHPDHARRLGLWRDLP
jgi:transposase